MKIFRGKSEGEPEVEVETDSLGRIEPSLGPIPPASPAPQAAPSAAQPHVPSPAAIAAAATAAIAAAAQTIKPAAHATQDEGDTAEPPEPKVKKPYRSSPVARLLATVAMLVVGWVAAMMIYYTVKYPDPLSIHSDKAPTIRILARDGSLLSERGRKHPFIPFDLLPLHVIEAVVAIEDRRFYQHSGVDVSGTIRAAFANLRAGRYAQGGSTITQQLAKNLYLSPERTLMRKLDELSLALWLELRLGKEDILELYLNQVYFGGGAYGIEAAAQRHFGKSARALTLAEGAVIAGLLKAPSRYSPSSNPAAARARGRVVLRAMHTAGYITSSRLKKALNKPVRFARAKPAHQASETAYATDYILEHMPTLLAGESGEIVVETSIDLQLQRLAQRKLTEKLRKNGRKLKAGQGALVILDRSGGIRALVGGANHAKSQYNRATKALRQPGSTFKPFVFLTALENGMKPETITYDLPLSISGWAPKNSNGQFRGKVTLREALAKSINTVAVRLALDFGPGKVANVAKRAGIKAKLRSDPSLALGTSEVSLLELTGAYALFANGGRRVEPHVIRRIRTASGRILFAHDEAANETVVALRNVGAMNDMLNAALIVGTGRKAALERHPAAGKTGTSQGFRDAWFVGYTAHLTAGIWLGNDKGAPMNRVVGGSLPADIWREVMREAHINLPPSPLPGTFRPGTRIGKGRQPFIARFKGGSSKRSSKPKKAASTPAQKHRRARIRISPPKKTALKKVVAAGKSFAPKRPPPLPQRYRRRRTINAHPSTSISPDFIARALAGVPSQDIKAPNRALAGSQRGFDLDDIRKRLKQAPPNTKRRGPYMALGAGHRHRSLNESTDARRK